MINFLKAFLFAIVIVALGILSILVIKNLDSLLGVSNFRSIFSAIAGIIFLIAGIILRVWAALLFYQNRLKVITLSPQQTFIKSGPYKLSRNPLYLGIVSIVFGSALLFGSPSGVIFSLLVFIGWNIYVRVVEEKTLEKKFGESYLQYKREIPRWFGLGFYPKRSML